MVANLPLVLTAVLTIFGVFMLVLFYGAWVTRASGPAAPDLPPAA